MARQYRIISGDSHLDFPPERWTPRVPLKWRDRAPRHVKLPNGDDAVIMENRPLHTVGHTRITGKSYDQHGIGASVYDGPGTGSPEQRMHEQDEDGIDAEVMYTHPVYMGFWRGLRENEGYLALIHAYNEFLAEEYSAANPSRLFPMGIIPDTGLDDALAELEYCQRAGMKGVALSKFPNGKGYPLPEDDRFWQAAIDLRMPITAHTNGGSTRFSREGPLFQYSRRPGDSAGERDPVSLLFRFAGDAPSAPLQMAHAGVFERFPQLRIYWAETQAGWLPYALPQIDDNYERNRYWGERFWGIAPMPHPPSYYLKNHCLWGFMDDVHAVRMRHDPGVNTLIWGSDFAHATGDWPHSLEVIDEIFAGVPQDERYAMLAGNVIEFFHLKDEVIEAESTGAIAAASR